MKRTLLLLPLLVLAACTPDGHDDLWTPEARFPDGLEAGPQVGQVTPTAAVISWHTLEPAVCGLECGPLRPSHAEPRRRHAFHLTGLQPATTYRYRLVVDGEPRPETYGFRTAPAPEAPFSFAVVGDPGNGSPVQIAIGAAMGAIDPAFVLTTGDNAYENGSREDVITRYLAPYADLMARVPFYPALGNHDLNADDGASFLELVELPDNGTELPERFYGFRWGSAHFICLDTNIDYGFGSIQHAWLASELARAHDGAWRIAYFHHPPYSSSSNGSDLDVRTALGPIFDEQRIDLVLSGHDHNYERTVPIRGAAAAGEAARSYTDPAGTIYVVSGGGGKRRYPAGKEWFTAYSKSIHHFLRIAIDGPMLTLEARDADNKVFDSLTITKTLR